jgi:hypothetical protein
LTEDNPVTTSSVSVLAGSEPYVGPRPFERKEADLFHGRKRDTQILCDRILTGRLTLLYAQSGLGKSSLLRTRVIPRVEAHGAGAVYFDNWSEPDPRHTLKTALVNAAEKAGVVDAGFGSPTVAELVRLIVRTKGRTVILVLDQFEEFLFRHAESLEPLRNELAALVSSDIDAAVVITLREEYLAALEPFRQRIINLFDSGYRLEELPDQDLRDAIFEPPKLYGGECEEKFVDKLISDLRGSTAATPSEGGASFVGLPMLQLVCQQLWGIARDGDKKLTLDLYAKMGGARKIIDAYVADLMPKRRRDKEVTARLLQFLAPGSGLKNPYSAGDLAKNTNLPTETVEKELMRLSNGRILRTRDYNNVVLYELQHDAFIRVLREWRDAVLDHRRTRRRVMRWGAASAIAMGLVIASSSYLQVQTKRRADEAASQQRVNLENQLMMTRTKDDAARAKAEADYAKKILGQETEIAQKEREISVLAQAKADTLQKWQEGGMLDDLRKMDDNTQKALAASRFDVLVSSMLGDPAKSEKLWHELRDNATLIPADYAMPSSDVITESIPKEDDVPLTVEYQHDRDFSRGHFMSLWRQFAGEITREYGYPLTLSVAFKEGSAESNTDVGKITLAPEPPNPPVIVDAPLHDMRLLVRYRSSIAKNSREDIFLKHYVDHDAQEFPSANQHWILVQKWTLPIWKYAIENEKKISSFEVASDASAMAAYHALSNLIDGSKASSTARRSLLTRHAVEALLRNASHAYPETVREARAERGPCLANDLGNAVSNDMYALMELPYLLDKASDTPCPTRRIESAQRGGVALEPRSPGRGSTTPSPAQAETADSTSADQIDDRKVVDYSYNLPQTYARFWFTGTDLSSLHVPHVRDQLYRSYGVLVDNKLIQKTSGDSHPAGPTFLEVKSGENGEALFRSIAADNRDRWITPEATSSILNRIPPHTRNWIRQSFSLTELKQIEKAVVMVQPDNGGTLRYPEWLLVSLCFWRTLDQDDPSIEAMAGHLREMQKARVNSVSPASSSLSQIVKGGIQSLLGDDNPDYAERQFEAAIRINRSEAEEAFLHLWANSLPEFWVALFDKDFANPRHLILRPEEKIDLQDLTPRATEPPNVYKQLQFYRIATGLTIRAERPGTLQELVEVSEPGMWTGEQEAYLATEYLRSYDFAESTLNNQRGFEDASAMIEHAVANLDRQDAYKVFSDVVGLCTTDPTGSQSSRSIPNWCWNLLDELARKRPGLDDASTNLQLELAWILSNEERPDRLKHALQLAQGYEQILDRTEMDSKLRSHQQIILDFIRGRALRGLGQFGDPALWAKAEALLQQVCTDEWVLSDRTDVAQDAYSRLISILNLSGRFGQAHALWGDAEKRWKGNPFIDGAALQGLLVEGNSKEVSQLSLNIAKGLGSSEESGEKVDSLFVSALGSILTQSGDWRALAKRYLAVTPMDPNNDYVLMLFYGMDGGARSLDASGLLDQRWAEIEKRKSDWKLRLASGDPSAWREMLLARYKNAPDVDWLPDVLGDEDKWKNSALSQLPSTRQGQLTEFWFYEALRAKANGNATLMREHLRRCLAVGMTQYYEDAMAHFLLSKFGN